MSTSTFAFSKHSVAWGLNLGPTWIQTNNTILNITDTETDNLIAQHHALLGDFGLNWGYVFALYSPPDHNNINWLNRLKASVNLRYTGLFNSTLNGVVQQYQDPSMSNYIYNLNFKNTRLMAELALNVFSMQKVSLFIRGGGGAGWSSLAYRDTPLLQDIGGGSLFTAKINNKLVTDAGAGLTYDLNEDLQLSLEYLYTYFGNLSINNQGILDGNNISIKSTAFTITSQAILFGITFKA